MLEDKQTDADCSTLHHQQRQIKNNALVLFIMASILLSVIFCCYIKPRLSKYSFGLSLMFRAIHWRQALSSCIILV